MSKPIDIEKEVSKIALSYNDSIKDGVKKALDKISKNTADEVNKRAAQLFKSRSRGRKAYSSSWTTESLKGKSGENTVYVKSNKYRLPHLLEYSHKVGRYLRGRYVGRPHIAPAEEKAIKDLEAEIERVIKQ